MRRFRDSGEEPKKRSFTVLSVKLFLLRHLALPFSGCGFAVSPGGTAPSFLSRSLQQCFPALGFSSLFLPPVRNAERNQSDQSLFSGSPPPLCLLLSLSPSPGFHPFLYSQFFVSPLHNRAASSLCVACVTCSQSSLSAQGAGKAGQACGGRGGSTPDRGGA